MRFLVMGAGALGCAFGGMLAASHNDVILVGRERLMKPIRERGLLISGIWGRHHVWVSAAVSSVEDAIEHIVGRKRNDDHADGAAGYPDVVLLTTKAYDTENAMKDLMPLLARSPSTSVLSFQNGIGNVQTIAKFVGEKRAIGGMVITGFEIDAGGDVEVKVTVTADKTKIGMLNGEITPEISKIVHTLNSASIPTEAVRNIQSHIWAKALYNAALNPLSTIFGVPYGELVSEGQQNALLIIEDIVKEAFAVAEAENIALFWKKPEEYVRFLRDVQIPKTASHIPSMLRDIERGRKTEIDFINGVFVRLGKRHGIPTPVNETIVRQIKFLEMRNSGRGDDGG